MQPLNKAQLLRYYLGVPLDAVDNTRPKPGKAKRRAAKRVAAQSRARNRSAS